MGGVRVVVLWFAALFLMACGDDVGVGQQGRPALKLNSLQPRSGEQDVDSNVEVIAVFSDDVVLGEGSDQVNPETFSLVGIDPPLEFDPPLEPEFGAYHSVVVLKPPALLSGVFKIDLKGTIAGVKSDPIGVNIDTSFTVVAP